MESNMLEIIAEFIKQFSSVVLSNPNIWVPVGLAWVLAFLYSRTLVGASMECCGKTVPMQKAQKELRIYSINFSISGLSYAGFNISDGLDVIQQSTLAGVVAVLLPLVWFKWCASKDKKP